MKKTKKHNMLTILNYIWKHEILRYITILLLLSSYLFAFTPFFDRHELEELAKAEKEDLYYFYIHDDVNFTKTERLIAKELAHVNDMAFMEITPVTTNQLVNILGELEFENNLNQDIYFHLNSHIKGITALNTLEQAYLTNSNEDFNHADYKKTKEFVTWIRKINKYRTKLGKITPYDDIIKKYARTNGLDWRLVAAQMFYESSFNPNSKSFAGAMGLMQLTPIAMKELGLRNAYDIEGNIETGIKYLKSRFKVFKKSDKETRLKFALASYNAGVGHVLDAQRLALVYGLNPQKWQGNMEQMILDLENSINYDFLPGRVKYGYCRGSETVNYVNNIIARYGQYRNLVAYD